MKIEDLIVSKKEAYQRIDLYIVNKGFPFSRSLLQKMIKEGLVSVNNNTVKPNYNLHPNDLIHINIPPPKSVAMLPEEIMLEIIYEDDFIVVVNKSAGMVVHPAPGNYTGTLVNALLNHCKGMFNVGGRERPGIIHRLDKDTSGVIIAAKTDLAHQEISKQFKAKEVEKTYLAIVTGNFKENNGRVELAIGRDIWERKIISSRTINPKEAVTLFKIKERFKNASLLEVKPQTGRTHQIRVHMLSIDHPIFGDKVYGGKNTGSIKGNPVNRQMLHAYSLKVYHPVHKKDMEFVAPIPEDMDRLLNILRNE